MTPFVLLSEILSSSEFDVSGMHMILELKCFRGIVFLSQYGDDIISTAKQIGKDIGFDNIDGLTLPADCEDIRNKIIRAAELERNRSSCDGVNIPKLIQSDIIYAVDNDLYEPFFQTQVSSKSGMITGFELLARLKKNNIVYPPKTFIPVIVSEQRISDFTLSLLKKSLRFILSVQCFSGTLSINVDYQSLAEHDFSEKLLKVIRRYRFPADRLTIELTESNPVINIFVMHNLNNFRMAGCCLSIDDFGTQNSGFTELLKLPFSELKIDKSFVQGLSDSPRAYKVVKALCAVAESLECKVIAEGVETEEQASALRELGVRHFQGFLYSKPLPIYDIEEQRIGDNKFYAQELLALDK